MAMYNLIEYSDKDSKKSGSSWHYYKDELFLNDNGVVTKFPGDNNNNSASFKLLRLNVLQSYCQSRTNIYNNWFETLCSTRNFINSR